MGVEQLTEEAEGQARRPQDVQGVAQLRGMDRGADEVHGAWSGTSSRRRQASVHEVEELLAAPAQLLHLTALLEVAVEEARDLARPGHGAQLHGEEGLHPHAVLLAGAPRDEGLEEGAHAPGIAVQGAALVDPIDQELQPRPAHGAQGADQLAQPTEPEGDRITPATEAPGQQRREGPRDQPLIGRHEADLGRRPPRPAADEAPESEGEERRAPEG